MLEVNNNSKNSNIVNLHGEEIKASAPVNGLRESQNLSEKDGDLESPSFSPINNNVHLSSLQLTFENCSIDSRIYNDIEYFSLENICEIVNYTKKPNGICDINKASKLVRDKYKIQFSIKSKVINKFYDKWYVTELGIYEFLNKCESPKANDFQDWVYKTIQTIRKTGSYSLPGTQSKQEISIADLGAIVNNITSIQLIQAESIKELIEFRKKAESNINWLYEEHQKTKYELAKQFGEQERIINSIQSNAAVNNYKDQFASNIKVSVVAEVSVSQYLNNIGRKRSSLVSIVHISNALTKAQRNAGMLYNHYSGSTKIFPVELLDQYFKAYPHHLK